MDDIGFEVEVRLAGGVCDKEAGVIAVCAEEAGAECLVDLIGGLRDAGADRGLDAIAPRAEAFHSLDRRIGHPGERAAPSGVGGTDDHRLVIGKQYRSTVGGKDSEQQIGPVGGHGVGAGPSVLRPRCVRDDHLGRVDLVNGCEFGTGVDRADREAAVAGDRLAVVVAPVADVQTRTFADGNAAAAAKKAVRELAEADGADHLDGQSIFLMMTSSSA